MKRIALPLSLLIVSLVACSERVPPAQPAEATPAPTAAAPMATGGDADWQGYGPLQLGISGEQLREGWGGELQGDAVADGGCYYLSPPQAGEAGPFFMIEADQFARYDMRGGPAPAPGGGRIGMDLAQLRALYVQAEAPQPHKYVEGGQTLRVPASDGSQSWLVFELGADGKVSAWRVGLLPQADYVEGCG